MSQDDSLNSNSESSGSSTSNKFPFYQEHIPDDHHETNMSDPALYGSSSLTRSGTVKRAGTNFLPKKESSEVTKTFSVYEDSDSVFIKEKSSTDSVNSRYRRSLDSTFRRSLESISEHKTKRSFSPTCTLSTTSRCSSSLESFSSEPENIIRSTANIKSDEGKLIQSPASSYLSWIGSVSNEFIASSTEVRQSVESNDVDSKVGEWNNFWLNYNSARSRYMSSAFLSADDRTADEMSEAKSINSNNKETTNRPSGEFILMTLDEIHEALKCSKKITEIFQSALTRNDHDCENSNFETSYYSESISRHTSSIKEDNGSIFTTEDLQKVARERSASYIVTTQDLLNKQKELLKPSTQSSSTSCINAILNTGVGDILKRVMNKRRDIMTPDDMSSVTRRSFSEWSTK